jgi:hypothetical protein
MIRAGAKAYRAGNKTEARALLERAIENDEYNESAWLWLSAVVDNKDEQRTCLENVLIINPENERARKGLRSLGVDPDSITGGAADDSAPQDEPAQATPAFTENIDEYNVPSSSASVSGGDEYSSDDYDQWMDDLDLGDTTTDTDNPADAFGGAVFDDDDFSSGAFDDISFDDVNYDDYSYEDTGVDDNEAIFTGDYDYDDQTGGADDYASTEALFEEDEETAYAGEDTYEEDSYDDDFFDYGEPENPDDILDESIFEEDIAAEADADIMAAFEQIPADIEPTRLPGEKEEGSSGGGLVTGVLVLFNLLAVGFIVAQFVIG